MDFDLMMQNKGAQIIAQFESDFANWDTLTAAQKDASNKRAKRAIALLLRSVYRQADSAGP